MRRLALWRAAPDDPHTPLGWLLADVRAGRVEPGASLSVALLLAVLALLWNPWPLLAFPLLALGTRRRSPNYDLTPLKTSPPPGPAFACRIETMKDVNVLGWGTLLGGDEGVVTFVEGWLHFAGRRTDFALRRADARATENGASGPRLDLPNDRTVKLTALNERDGERLCRALTLWSNATTPEGEAIFPPEGVNPLGLARAWHGASMTIACAFFVVGLAIFTKLGFFVLLGFSGFEIPASFRKLAEVRRLARADRVSLNGPRPALDAT